MTTFEANIVGISNSTNVYVHDDQESYVILITMGYNDAIMLPLSMINMLGQLIPVSGGNYSTKNLTRSSTPLDIKIISRKLIGPMPPDKELAKVKMQETKAKLLAELESIDKELNA